MASPSLLTGEKDIYLTPDMAKIEGTGYNKNWEQNPRLNSGIETSSFTVNRRTFAVPSLWYDFSNPPSYYKENPYDHC